MLWAEKFMSTSRPKGTGTAVPSCRLRTTTTASLLARHAGLGNAVADNRVVTAEALPKAGAKPNVCDEKGWRPLCHALYRASVDLVRGWTDCV